MKKITIKSLMTAIKEDTYLQEFKVVAKDYEKRSLIIANACCIVEFSILGQYNEYLGFSISGYANYTLCQRCVNLMEKMENENK